MGQALRRATGRLRSSRPEPPPELAKNPELRRQRDVQTSGQDRLGISDSEDISRIKDDHGILEERDPRYDGMLSKMVGTIASKPGGKLEMGEAFIVEKYNRPLPKLRSSKAEATGGEQKSAPPGNLSVAQLQQIILLHQGKSDEHQGRMEVHDIARKFNIDAAHVERIVQFVSLPPEDHNNSQK